MQTASVRQNDPFTARQKLWHRAFTVAHTRLQAGTRFTCMSWPECQGSMQSGDTQTNRHTLVRRYASAIIKVKGCSRRLKLTNLAHKGQANATQPLIKICGVVSEQDARLASEAGADFVGMIMWPKARRSVSVETAARISETAREYGAKPVAVFVDEDFADIVRACKATGIASAQLHGKAARAALPDLPNWLEVVYVMHANPDGSLHIKHHNPDPVPQNGRAADWLLLDGLTGGSGQTFDWDKLQPPSLIEGTKGWLLAGGLTPQNVAQAISLAKPNGVDVSSGVTGPDRVTKDPKKIHQFIEEVRKASRQL